MLNSSSHHAGHGRPSTRYRGAHWRLRAGLLVCTLLAAATAAAESSFITVENRSDEFAKIALPGARAARVPPGTQALRIDLEVTRANGVEAKAWWVSNPRQLCVIFVRYEGHVVIAGDNNIHCLGH